LAKLALSTPAVSRSGGLMAPRFRLGRSTAEAIWTHGRNAVADRVGGLDAGADDYLVKPFDLDELSARLRALHRRSGGRATPVLENGRLVLDPAAHEVLLEGVPVSLSPREFSLLQLLLEHPGRPVSRARLEESLYGWGEEVESNASWCRTSRGRPRAPGSGPATCSWR
jgi:two-component system response regulator QseB